MYAFKNSELPMETDQHLVNQFSLCFVKTSALLLFGNKINLKT